MTYVKNSPVAILVSFITLISSRKAASSFTCLDYLACYNEYFMDYKSFEIYHEDLEVRSADSCGVLCRERLPEVALVMAKMIAMNERLVCGCGGEGALGNSSGVVSDDVFCSGCPEDRRQKCGGEATVSVYRWVFDEDGVCDEDVYGLPSLSLPATEPITGSTTVGSSTVEQITGSSTAVSPTTNPTSGSPATEPTDSTKNLVHRGCFYDGSLNVSLIEPHFLNMTETPLSSCLSACKNLTSGYRSLLFMRLLSDSFFFCGCGSEESLGQPVDDVECEESANVANECYFECPSDTYSAYSYSRAGPRTPLPPLILFALAGRVLLGINYW